MAEDDDVAVATVRIEFDDRWLHDADRADGRAQKRVGLGGGFRLAELVGIFLQAARIGRYQLHGNDLSGFGRTRCPSLLVFFSKTSPEPQDGPAAAIAAEHARLADKRGLQPCEGKRAWHCDRRD